MKIKIGFWHYILLLGLTAVNIVLGVVHTYLSQARITFDFPTALTFNIAVLSLIIIISAFLVTVFGLARLQSIEEKALDEARIVARNAVSEELTSVKDELVPEVKEGIQKVVEMSDTIKEQISTLSSSEISHEEEQEETENDISGN